MYRVEWNDMDGETKSVGGFHTIVEAYIWIDSHNFDFEIPTIIFEDN